MPRRNKLHTEGEKMVNMVFKITEDHFNRFLEIGRNLGLKSYVEVFRYLITKETKIPAYVQVQKENNELRKAKISRTPQEIAQAKLDEQEAREKAKEDKARSRQVAICNEMEGTIDGEDYCNYKAYSMRANGTIESYEEKNPVMYLNEDSLKNQYDTYDKLPREEAKKLIEKILKEQNVEPVQ